MSQRFREYVFGSYHHNWYGVAPVCYTCEKPIVDGERVVAQRWAPHANGKIRHRSCYERLFQ